MGSFILSFLTFKAMEVIIDEFGPTNIIYPDLYKQPLVDWFIKKNLNFEPYGFKKEYLQLPTIPNRFVAILPLINEDGTKEGKDWIEDIAKQMKKKIGDTIKEAKETIFSELKPTSDILDENKIKKIQEKINSQLSEFPEIYWVALPWKIKDRVKIKDRDILPSDFENILDNNIFNKYENLWNFADKEGEFDPNIGLLYELIYSVLERFMGSRKNVRIFKQPDVEEKGRKCSVCGERDVVFFKETRNKSKFTRYNNLVNNSVVYLTEKNIPIKFIADGEGLCAICFLKRTFEIYLKKEVSNVFKDLTFPSTAEIACADFKEKMLLNAKNEYQEYLGKFKSLLGNQFVRPSDKIKNDLGNLENLEGTWFYEENLTEKYIRDELGTSIEPSKIKELKDLLKKITDKVGKPNPYYALIYLDGDNMGKWLAGELLPAIEHSYASETWEKELPDDFKNEIKNIRPKKLLTPAIHASISTALRNYALEFVRKIIEEEHLGKLVYAGGDDVLAFINLKDLLDVIHKLRWAFSGNVKINSNGKIEVDLDNETGFVEKDGRYLLTMGPNASASMGIVIAHYKTPLQIVIRKVFEMEKIAKENEKKIAKENEKIGEVSETEKMAKENEKIGEVFEMEKIAKENEKNSFAICLMRRSGEERIAVAKWRYREDTINILKEIVRAFDEKNERGYIAKSFIKKINKSLSDLKNNGTFVAAEKIFSSELSRLLDRSFNQPKGKKVEKEKRKEF
ncbi:MAG: type III-B CRISPR-associated protein Cas10/Cmr2, partial [Candidatus Calescibacterium sp.]|nr:type III-B CRISPR-associated protein Cas10/Cmr2 [Candidatus Calescibacterium sp.]